MANVTETQQRKQTEGSRRGGLPSGGVAEVGLIWWVGAGGGQDGWEREKGFGSGEVPTERGWEEDVEPAEPVGLELACEQHRRRRTSPDLHTFHTPPIIVLPNKNNPYWLPFFTQCRYGGGEKSQAITQTEALPFHFFFARSEVKVLPA